MSAPSSSLYASHKHAAGAIGVSLLPRGATATARKIRICQFGRAHVTSAKSDEFSL